MKRLLLLGVPALLFGLGPAACSLGRGARRSPLPLSATRALAEARELARTRPEGWGARAEEAAARAAAAAPDWVAPQRVLDDLLREGGLGHEALALRRAALEPEATAAELYLVGRLEGEEGLALIEHAANLDPELAWAQHGLAWHRFLAGRARAALREGRRAVELARGSYELGQFAHAQARYLVSLGRVEEAAEFLEDALADEALEEPERTELGVALTLAELESEEPPVIERAFWRALLLLEDARMAADEYDRLGEALLARLGLVDHPSPESEVLAALEHGRGEGRERLRARVLMERGAHGLAAALWERAGGAAVPGSFRRARDLERGDAARALDSWLAALPRGLTQPDGLPREPALRALVLSARACGGERGASTSEAAVRFGQALLDAGWFAEAESWSQALAEHDPDAAFALSARAAAGQALLAGIRSVLDRVDEGREAFLPGRLSGGGLESARRIETLDELLAALQPFFERYHEAPLESALSDSPRRSFGAFASIVHPGPRFSASDERAELGAEGELVPGLARELARIGRFGIFGQAPGGGGPDGTVLRLIGSEWRRGEHLGVAFEGLVAWCEGTDVPSRPSRSGAGVVGAALHEGYWVDVEGVRRDWERLRALERAFAAADRSRIERALSGRGPRLSDGASDEERARWMAPLGEGQRVLWTVLAERGASAGARDAGERAARIALDEVLELTALHEEGHLTDQARFLPLARNWTRVLAFVLRHGFTPRTLSRALEYRAQLVALCVAPEPRLVLAECLGAADGEDGVLTHAEAYRALMSDLLQLAAREIDAYPALAREHHVLYQLHRLSADDVRALALELARAEGLVEE